MFNWLMTQPNNNSASENEAKKIFKQLLEALIHFHARGIAHRDIKLDNILVSEDPITHEVTPKFIDFGLSTVIFPGQSSS